MAEAFVEVLLPARELNLLRHDTVSADGAILDDNANKVRQADLRPNRMFRRLDPIEYLTLDDIGYVQHDRTEMEVSFAPLPERYERRSVAVTFNLAFLN